MSALIQLPEPIAVDTPLGEGWAVLVESQGHEQYWTVALNEGGGLVTFLQERIRVHRSYTHERDLTDAQMRDIVKRK